MNWLEKFSLRRFVRRFETGLPRFLAASYGKSKTYTFTQVTAALIRFKLQSRWVAVAYAVYLTEPDYLANAEAYPAAIPYDAARELYDRYRSWISGDWDVPMDIREAALKYGPGAI